MVFQLPHHFEALRCTAIERLWDGQQGREPMHDLMGDIMEYCRKPELRLDCPREDVFVEKPARADFMFIDCGVVYGVSREGKSLVLYRMCTAVGLAPSTTKLSDLCLLASEGVAWRCYYDEGTRHLVVLYDNGGTLSIRDMANGKTKRPIMLPCLASRSGRLAGVIVIGDLLYAAMVFIKKGLYCRFEIRYVQCRKAQEVRLAYEFHEPGDDPSFSFIRFSPVPDRPRAVDFIYKSDSTLHSMKIDVVRESGPTLFSTRRDEMVESERIRGSLIRNTPGLGFLLIEEGDFYVLRHGRGLKKAARIAKCGTTLPSSVVFGDWSFRYTLKLITEDLAVVKYHPYLL
ncbi:hypothetical protein FOL46_008053 [Perkinsus olseni]|uniref:Uncharacterized protein n=1 Tax=Perkinsus olseni TaxID=32597 RepID=A0A7J6L9X7_PEROL|nr:hypothetical protein FOL46_008053 [Perkinsus olseni]